MTHLVKEIRFKICTYLKFEFLPRRQALAAVEHSICILMHALNCSVVWHIADRRETRELIRAWRALAQESTNPRRLET